MRRAAASSDVPIRRLTAPPPPRIPCLWWNQSRRERLWEVHAGIGVSLILIAIGAILAWAVNYSVSGVDINVVGGILMVVGVIGLLMSLLFWSAWAPWGRRETTVVDDPYQRDRMGHDQL